MDRPVILIGGGGHIRVLIGVLQRNNRTIRGIITTNQEWLGKQVMGVPVLGEQYSYALDPTEVTLVNAVGNKASRSGSGLNPRAEVYLRFRHQGLTFFPLLSEHAIIQPHVHLEEGVQVMPGAVLQPGVQVGENTLINTAASIDHDCVIGAHSHIAPGATLCGEVQVGLETHVGAGAVIIQGVKVGNYCVIGAGAVVTQDVPDHTIVRSAATKIEKILKA